MKRKHIYIGIDEAYLLHLDHDFSNQPKPYCSKEIEYSINFFFIKGTPLIKTFKLII